MAKRIIVTTHRRSGTHFLLDCLRNNVPGATFPVDRRLPKDFNVGSLFRKDETVYRAFRDRLESDGIVLIKSHLLPEELYIRGPSDRHERLIAEIARSSSVVNVFRDGRDVLTSLYRFLRSEVSFGDFIREPNDHVAAIRRRRSWDRNRVRYWAHHVTQWHRHPDALSIRFRDLREDFVDVLGRVAQHCGVDPVEGPEKPELPRSRLLHRVQLKLRRLGVPLDARSTARLGPERAHHGRPCRFTDDDLAFYRSEAADALDLFDDSP